MSCGCLETNDRTDLPVPDDIPVVGMDPEKVSGLSRTVPGPESPGSTLSRSLLLHDYVGTHREFVLVSLPTLPSTDERNLSLSNNELRNLKGSVDPSLSQSDPY